MRHATNIVMLALAVLVAACAMPSAQAEPPARQVLFVCEHGNVKSLMAATYFNDLARARSLPFKAVSRGSAPDSDTVPDFVKKQLSAEGFDVSQFRPAAASRADAASSDVVVTIGTQLPADATIATVKVEQWNDIPPASSDYAKSSAALKAHVSQLLERLERDAR